MTKTYPAWATPPTENFLAVDDLTPEEANALGAAINDLVETGDTPGSDCIGIPSAEFNVDGLQSVTTLFRSILRNIHLDTANKVKVDVAGAAAPNSASWPSIIALANGNLLCAYYDGGGDEGISCKISADKGVTWGVAITIYKHAATVETIPWLLQLANGTVLCFFQTSEDSATNHIKCMKSTDNGATWGTKVNVCTSESVNYPCACQLENGNVLCFFGNGASNAVLKSISTDNGATWSVAVTMYSGSVDCPGVYVFNGRIYFWARHNDGGGSTFRFYKSDDNGESWSGMIGSFSTTSTTNRASLLFFPGGGIVAVYSDGSNLYATISRNQCVTWIGQKLIAAVLYIEVSICQLSDSQIVIAFETVEDAAALHVKIYNNIWAYLKP